MTFKPAADPDLLPLGTTHPAPFVYRVARDETGRKVWVFVHVPDNAEANAGSMAFDAAKDAAIAAGGLRAFDSLTGTQAWEVALDAARRAVMLATDQQVGRAS